MKTRPTVCCQRELSGPIGDSVTPKSNEVKPFPRAGTFVHLADCAVIVLIQILEILQCLTSNTSKA